MQRTQIKSIYLAEKDYDGKAITVCGWARSIRASNAFGFIELNDGSCAGNLQVVFEADKLANYAEIAKQNVGAALVVRGTLVLTPDAKQPFELKADAVEVEGVSTPEYPLQKKKHSFEFLRTIAHLRPRANTFNAVFRVRSECAFAIHEFFNDRGFVYVNTPIITTSDCEGAGEMFRVTSLDLDNLPKNEDGSVNYAEDFFGKPTSLTVSGQLNAECFALAFGNVYTFGPTFRAERSNTQRHAAEFWMMEPEMAFADLEDDMEIAEAMIKHVVRHVMATCKQELAFFNRFFDNTLLERLQNLVDNDFGRVTYTEAIRLLEESGNKFDYPVSWGIDLQTEHERYLTEKIFGKPLHPYTTALFSAIPIPDPDVKLNRIILKGSLPSPANPPAGCKFHTRCDKCMDICRCAVPEWSEVEPGHWCACHLYNDAEQQARAEEALKEAKANGTFNEKKDEANL